MSYDFEGSNVQQVRQMQVGNCLFTQMKPSKHLAVISLARAQRVTHIIEEGVYGGLSTFLFYYHGFNVTGIEHSPNAAVVKSLRRMAPSVRVIHGDGRRVLPKLARQIGTRHRLLVIFDGSKRFAAYHTYKKLSSYVVFAVFDDTQNEEGLRLRQHWQERGEIAWPHFLELEDIILFCVPVICLLINN